MSAKFEKGQKVFCSYDPGRHGHITGNERVRADNIYYQVEFSNSDFAYVPHYELERVDTNHSNPEWLIEQRKFGNASDLRRNFSHIQMGGKLSSMIYSLDITNTDFYPYQFKPVLAFLESPSRGLLIADEVGLGKTIEAGLIWTELRARYDYRRVLVVCPAMLREKWQDELQVRFGVDATIMDAAELCAELKRPPNQIADGKGIICSIQGIRAPSTQQLSRGKSGARAELARFLGEQSDNLPIIDLVIIDEAHYLRNRESQSWRVGKMLRDVSENVLLLSATPINLRSDDLFTLLNIVDPDTFDVPGFFPQVLHANEPLVRARALAVDKNATAKNIREHLDRAAKIGHDFLGNSMLLQKVVEMFEHPDSIDTDAKRVRLANMIDRVNLLRHVVNRTRKSEVMEWKVIRRPLSKFVELDDEGVEKNFYDSVTDAIRGYAAQHEVNDGFLLASPQRQVSSCMYAAAKSWKDRAPKAEDLIYENFGTEPNTADDVSPLIGHLAANVLPSVSLQKLRACDSKFKEFYSGIADYMNRYPEEKIVVFSYFRATLAYLDERLTEQGIASQVLVGGMRESKQDVINRFRENHTVKVLLSSEVASEGVDLQFCRLIVNYDLPWNPMKIEQRIGRLDRIGQAAESIVIWNFGYAGTIDQRVYERLFERLEIFKRALGGMEAILGEKIKNLTDYLMRHRLTPAEEEQRIEQTAVAIENIRQEEERLEKDAASLIAHSGYILEKVKTAFKLKMRITEDDLIVYVRDYLSKHSAGHEFYQPDGKQRRFHISLPAKTAAQLKLYVEKHNLYGQTKLVTGERMLCEFANNIAVAPSGIERITQFHPLIRFIGTKISDEDFFPVVAAKLCSQSNNIELELPGGQYAFALQQWKFGGFREEMDIRVRAVHVGTDFSLDAENSWKLLNQVRLYGVDWPESATMALPQLADKVFDCNDYLDQEFRLENEIKRAENTDRINWQINSAEQHRDRQIQTLENVLQNFMARNQTRLIPATQKRIENIKKRFAIRIEELRGKLDMSASKKHACMGVLLIE